VEWWETELALLVLDFMDMYIESQVGNGKKYQNTFELKSHIDLAQQAP